MDRRHGLWDTSPARPHNEAAGDLVRWRTMPPETAASFIKTPDDKWCFGVGGTLILV